MKGCRTWPKEQTQVEETRKIISFCWRNFSWWEG